MDPFEFRKAATAADGTILKMNSSRWKVVAGLGILMIGIAGSSGYPMWIKYTKVTAHRSPCRSLRPAVALTEPYHSFYASTFLCAFIESNVCITTDDMGTPFCRKQSVRPW